MATRGRGQRTFELSPITTFFCERGKSRFILFEAKFYVFVQFLSSTVIELPRHINKENEDVLPFKERDM